MSIIIHRSNLPNSALILAIGESLSTQTQEIDVTENQLNSRGMQRIVQFRQFSQLTQLKLGSNLIGDEGTKILSIGLKDHQNLKELDLSINSIGREGAYALGQVLKTTRIQILKLAGNSIGNMGASSLCEGLRMHPTLYELDLFSCGIKEEGFRSVAKVVACSRSLQSLCLSFNAFDPSLLSALKVNSSLKVLKLQRTRISDEHVLQLRELLIQKKIDLHMLDLRNNQMGQQVVEVLITDVLGGVMRGTTFSSFGTVSFDIAHALPEEVSKRLDELLYDALARVFEITQGLWAYTEPDLTWVPGFLRKWIFPSQFQEAEIRAQNLSSLQVIDLKNHDTVHKFNYRISRWFKEIEEFGLPLQLNVEELFLKRLKLDGLEGKILLHILGRFKKVRKIEIVDCHLTI